MNVLDNGIKYCVGRTNLALTIFVPYDCPNHCKFCTSKEDYKDTSTFSLDKILESVKCVADLEPIKDIVITGGEPFADLVQLQQILDVCSEFKKNIFINTTLPIKDKEAGKEILEFVIKNEKIINGINISRHMCLKTNLEDDRLIMAIHAATKIPLRINSVLIGVKAEEKKVAEFISKYEGFVNSINFRGDYTKVKDQNDLRGLDHPILKILFNMNELIYLGSGGCLVCNNNDFRKGHLYISLHRGYEHSLVIAGNNYIINDLIIKQDGNILMDWDGQSADIYRIKKQWNII